MRSEIAWALGVGVVAFLATALVVAGSFPLAIGIGLVVLVLLIAGIRFVPEAERHVVERFHKYHRVLHPGVCWIIPLVDIIRHEISIRERVINVPRQKTLTKDDIQVEVDPTLFFKVLEGDENVRKAAYGVEIREGGQPSTNLDAAMTEFAIASLRSVIGTMTLDDATDHQEKINQEVVKLMNGDKGAGAWGSDVTRHVVKELIPPPEIMDALRKQVTAEKEKKAAITTSEAQRDAAINVADGQKQATIKAAEAEREAQIKRAEGEAKALELIANAIGKPNGDQAVSLRIAQETVTQFGQLAKASTNTVVPMAIGDIGCMVKALLGILPAKKGS